MNKPAAVKYRLDVSYYSKDYDDKAAQTSAPIYSLEEGLKKYEEAIKQKCFDRTDLPVLVHLWEYNWDENGRLAPITIKKNYSGKDWF